MTVVDSIGIHGSDKILAFLRNNVFPHEDNFAGHHYHQVRSFQQYSNSCLEGTNNGLKYNSHRVLPLMGLGKAGKTMVDQDEKKATLSKITASAEFHETPLYTSTPTSKHLKPVAETMLQQQSALIEAYASVRISFNKWLVMFSAKRSGNESSLESKHAHLSVIPVFNRVRTVILDHDGRLHCDCGYSMRNGVPDRHVIHVATKYGNSFTAFTHQSVAVRFWLSYDYFVATSSSSEGWSDNKNTSQAPAQACSIVQKEARNQIRDKLLQARHRQSVGAFVPGGFCPLGKDPQYIFGDQSDMTFSSMDPTAAVEYFTLQHQQAINHHIKVVNYTSSQIKAAILGSDPSGAETSSSMQAIGLTQETHNADDDNNYIDNEPHDIILNFNEQNSTSFCAWQSARLAGISQQKVYEIVFPRMKELINAFENDLDELLPLVEVIDQFIQEKKKRNAEAKSTPPVGRFVSCLAAGKGRRQHSHKKQKHQHHTTS